MCTLSVFAQNECSKNLKEAQLMLDGGDLYHIANKLNPCIASGFTKEEKVKAYVLMTEAYLYTGEREKAQETYLKMLKLRPLYEPYEQDAAELHDYHNIFTTNPIFNFPNIRIGMNRTYIQVINDYHLDGYGDVEQTITPMGGLDVALGGDLNFYKGFSLSLMLGYKQRRFSYETVMLRDLRISYIEQQDWLEVPLMIKYSPISWKSKLTPYAMTGISFGFLLKSTAADIQRENNNTRIDEKDITGSDVVLTSSEVDQRKRNYNFFNATLGAKYRIKEKYLAIDFTYQFGFRNMLKTGNEYQNTEGIYKYGYIEDDFRVNNILVAITYINPLYFPRIKKAHRVDVE